MDPKNKPKTYPTGIDGLDTILGGGIPDMSVILVHGSSGSGCRTFVQQILYKRSGSGGKVGYLTVERSSKDIEEDMMAVYGWSLDTMLQDGRWTFGNIYGLRHQGTQIKPGAVMPSQRIFSVINTVHSEALKMMAAGRWIALDSVSSMFFAHDLKDIAYFIEVLTMATRTYGGVHFLISMSGLNDYETLPVLTNLVDGVIEFSIKDAPAQRMVPEGIMRITKMRRLPPALRTLEFSISTDGVTV